MKSRKIASVVIAWLAMLAMAITSLAGITGTLGAVTDVSGTPPTSVALGATESDLQTILFSEVTDLALAAAVNVNISTPGAYNFPGSAPYSPGTIAAGNVVNSYFLHFDRVTDIAYTRLAGSVTFSCPIIGVIALTNELDASDSALGRAGTTYPTGTAAFRGLEFEESVMLSADRLTLTVVFEIAQNENTFDQIRVITQCPAGRCPHTQGFWKNHPEDWPVTSLVLGSQTYNQAELLAIFNTSPRGDASLILADQLIAAKLNLASGTNPITISATIAHADSLLSMYSGKLPYRVKTSSTRGLDMVSDATMLDNYNNGLLTPSCDR